MSKTVLVISSMAAAIVLACMAAVLMTATPGDGKPRTVTLIGAGDIAGCEFNQDRKTARLLGKIHGTVFTLGDNVYPGGSRKQFRECYDPTWGKYKKRTRPSLGDQDYKTSGASSGAYSPKLVEAEFCEIRLTRVLGSPSGLRLAPKLSNVAPVTIGALVLKRDRSLEPRPLMNGCLLRGWVEPAAQRLPQEE